MITRVPIRRYIKSLVQIAVVNHEHKLLCLVKFDEGLKQIREAIERRQVNLNLMAPMRYIAELRIIEAERAEKGDVTFELVRVLHAWCHQARRRARYRAARCAVDDGGRLSAIA